MVTVTVKFKEVKNAPYDCQHHPVLVLALNRSGYASPPPNDSAAPARHVSTGVTLPRPWISLTSKSLKTPPISAFPPVPRSAISFVLDEKGQPRGIHVVQGYSNMWNARAVEAVSKLHYVPASLDNQPIPMGNEPRPSVSIDNSIPGEPGRPGKLSLDRRRRTGIRVSRRVGKAALRDSISLAWRQFLGCELFSVGIPCRMAPSSFRSFAPEARALPKIAALRGYLVQLRFADRNRVYFPAAGLCTAGGAASRLSSVSEPHTPRNPWGSHRGLPGIADCAAARCWCSSSFSPA